MLDNRRNSPFIQQGFENMPYANQVEIFDKNCAECPFATFHTRYGDSSVLKKHKTLTDAQQRVLFKSNVSIVRGCSFNDDELSLTEIIRNTCRLWRSETCEGGGDEGEIIEITTTVETAIEHRNT